MTGFQLKRIGMIMEPRKDDPNEVEGVLNPAAMRGKDGQLYLFPRLVARKNFSRIGIARVLFDAAGEPRDVERMGIALEPEADYEFSTNGGGCEDPRITYVEPLRQYVMTYTALSRHGPRIAIAVSDDLFHWRRGGLAIFRPFPGLPFDTVDDKDASTFPVLIPDPLGRPAIGLVHRPLFPGTRPEEKLRLSRAISANTDMECIWLSYCHLGADGAEPPLGAFVSHLHLACPVTDWDHLKIGGGAPPILCQHGWLMLYHGVRAVTRPALGGGKFSYSAGAMVLSKKYPSTILYRSPDPVLVPEGPLESTGIVDDVVFPTGVDRRDDLGTPNRFDTYYGMADDRIGVARLDVPAALPESGLSAKP
jgi:beta-1,2-mannobiose phosphorylase / 1,2-beta-oligomannan phosphorylase